MENQKSSDLSIFNGFSLLFLIFSLSCFFIFAISSLFYSYTGHKPSYYITQTILVSDFSVIDNTLSFKSNSSYHDYSIVFKEPPIIQKNDKIKIEFNRNKEYVQVYVNKKLIYDKYSNIILIIKYHDKKTGKYIISTIKNIQ